MDFAKMDALKKRLDEHRPLPPALVKNLRDALRIEWTYNSNAIEGNTLSLLETKLVIEEGITIGGKKLKEHLEAVNHAEAIDFVEQLVEKKETLNERILKQIHYLVLKNIDNENAGRYRTFNVRIAGSRHNPPHFLKVQEEMEALLDWYNREKERMHPVELAARFHFRFVYVHPFSDGNGRTARLLMNLILMQFGYPPAIIKAAEHSRQRYYETLETASVEGNLLPFLEFIAECVEESLRQYLNALGLDVP